MAYVAVPYFGNKALIVRSGSMTPAIGVGDLVVVNTGSATTTPIPGVLPKYRVGDIIAFRGQKDANTVVTHRISAVKVETDTILYETKGDANNAPDNNLTEESKIIGKSTFRIPTLGKVFAAAKTKEGFFALILTPAVLVILFEIVNIIREIRKVKRKKSDNEAQLTNQPHGNVLLRILIPFIIGTLFFQNSFASYADTETSSGNSLQAAESYPQTTPPGETQTPTPLADHLVISEVQIDRGTSDLNDHDFIEVYNPTNSVINLDGFRLVKRTAAAVTDANIFTFTGSHTVPAHGFFLWAHNSAGNDYAATISADVSSAQTLGSDNSIAIRQGAVDAGTIIDALSWDATATLLEEGLDFFPDPTNDQSMERKALSTSDSTTMLGADSVKGNGYDTDSNALDFTLRLISQPQNSSSSTETP